MESLCQELIKEVDNLTYDQARKVVSIMMRNGHINYIIQYHEEIRAHHRACVILYEELFPSNKKKAHGEALRDVMGSFKISKSQVYAIINSPV